MARCKCYGCVALLALIVLSYCLLARRPWYAALPNQVPEDALVASNLKGASSALGKFRSAGPPQNPTSWQLFYGLLGSGGDFDFEVQGERTSCEQWLLGTATWQPVMLGASIATTLHGVPTFLGDLEPDRPKGFEGHFCQELFILSRFIEDPTRVRIRLPPDSKSGTLMDLAVGAQTLCTSSSDLSWALPAFAAWNMPSSWTNRFGEKLSLDDLAMQHLHSESVSTACLGTHWKFAVASIVAENPKRFSSGTVESARGALEKAMLEARLHCREDGRFWLETPPGLALGRDEEVGFQAHTLGWLLCACSPTQAISEHWLNLAVDRLLLDLNADGDLSYGTRCHAAFALRLYQTKLSRAPVARRSP